MGLWNFDWLLHVLMALLNRIYDLNYVLKHCASVIYIYLVLICRGLFIYFKLMVWQMNIPRCVLKLIVVARGCKRYHYLQVTLGLIQGTELIELCAISFVKNPFMLQIATLILHRVSDIVLSMKNYFLVAKKG